MQQTEIVIDARPRRAAQVVPTEPSLRHRYDGLIVAAITLLFAIVIIVLAYIDPFGISLSGYRTLWTHSFLIYAMIMDIAFPLSALPGLSYWRKLNQRRQQAARYNLAVRAGQRPVALPSSGATPLPDAFTISTERDWKSTRRFIMLGFLCVCLLGALAWSYWTDTQQAVQQGASMALVIANTCLNLALILAWTLFCLTRLIYAPRQRLVVTRDGLFCRHGYQACSIAWQEARLFALISQAVTNEQEPLFFYELASKDVLIRWPSLNKPVHRSSIASVPSRVTLFDKFIRSSKQFPQQVQFLNIIVAERTGLQLYDLR